MGRNCIFHSLSEWNDSIVSEQMISSQHLVYCPSRGIIAMSWVICYVTIDTRFGSHTSPGFSLYAIPIFILILNSTFDQVFTTRTSVIYYEDAKKKANLFNLCSFKHEWQIIKWWKFDE